MHSILIIEGNVVFHDEVGSRENPIHHFAVCPLATTVIQKGIVFDRD